MLPEQPVVDAPSLNLTHNVIRRDLDAFSRAINDNLQLHSVRGTLTNLFSSEAYFVSAADFLAMTRLVQTVEQVVALPGFRPEMKARVSEAGLVAPMSSGAFMGFDFHLTADGPRLIEINTNAGGAFLNAFVARTLTACCEEMTYLLDRSPLPDFETYAVRMIVREWQAQGHEGRPSVIAIIDEDPPSQFLYPEFLMAQSYFERHGMTAVIADASELDYRADGVFLGDLRIDFIYNRLTDFALTEPAHAALSEAWKAGKVVLSPSPLHHQFYASKKNLVYFSDAAYLRNAGASEEMIAALRLVPQTVEVTAANEADLWDNRTDYFFKPLDGFGSKAVWRGDKLTRKNWNHVRSGGYVAQRLAVPCSRSVIVNDGAVEQKVDLRLYSYAGEVFLVAARLYQGQTTNFRTPGGGFAHVFIV